MHTDRTHSRGLGITRGVMVVVALACFLGLWRPSQAAEFTCAGGDVACLIDAINTANANGEENTLTLEAGTYTLTAVDNTTDGPNGLPSVTSALPLTLRGAGAESTIIERAADAPLFRLVQVAATGTLVLEELALQGGRVIGATNSGGGIANRGTLTVTNSAFSGNSVCDIDGNSGGGLRNFVGGTVTVTNSTFSGNSATGIFNGGGGLFNLGGLAGAGTLTLTNSTITGNSVTGTSSSGGGLATAGAGAAALQNTIVALNTAAAGPDCAGAVTSQGHNLVGDPTGCTLPLLPSDLTGDPGLEAFTDDGTPGHGHFPLLPTSPAIDAGDDTVCPATDQLGQPRVGRCDIGAIEFQPALTSCGGTGAARVRGRVRAADYTGIGAALVTLTGPAGCRETVTTTAQGHYVFRSLGPGTYTITVTKDACTFTPAARTVTLAASDVRARFRGTCP